MFAPLRDSRTTQTRYATPDSVHIMSSAAVVYFSLDRSVSLDITYNKEYNKHLFCSFSIVWDCSMNRCFSLYYSLSLCVCVIWDSSMNSMFIFYCSNPFCYLWFAICLFVHSFIHSHHFKWIYKHEGFPPWDLCGLMAFTMTKENSCHRPQFQKSFKLQTQALKRFHT